MGCRSEFRPAPRSRDATCPEAAVPPRAPLDRCSARKPAAQPRAPGSLACARAGLLGPAALPSTPGPPPLLSPCQSLEASLHLPVPCTSLKKKMAFRKREGVLFNPFLNLRLPVLPALNTAFRKGDRVHRNKLKLWSKKSAWLPLTWMATRLRRDLQTLYLQGAVFPSSYVILKKK